MFFFDKISGLWTDLILFFKINSDYLELFLLKWNNKHFLQKKGGII